MKALSSLFVLTVLLSSCQQKNDRLNLSWKVAGTLPAIDQKAHIGVAGPIVGILDGKLLVAGGANFPDKMPWDGGAKFYQAEAYLYDILGDSLVFNSTISFPDTLAYSANVTVDQTIYAIGGENKEGMSNQVTQYRWTKGKLKADKLANLPVALSNGAAVQVGEYIYYVGGENGEVVSNKVYRMPLKGGAWETVIELPYALTHTIAVSDAVSKIYLIGGRKRNTNLTSDMYDQVLELDLITRQITEITKLPQALAAGTGVFYNNRLIVIGGDNASTFHRAEKLIGEINTCTDELLKKDLIAQKNKIQREHPGFSKEVYALNLENLVWETLPPLVGESPVTTTSILHDGKIIIPSGEVRAGVRTPQILVGKL